MRRITLLSTLLFASQVFATQTSHWSQTNEADFNNGTLHNVVATNLGDLKLSRAVKTLLEQDAKVSAVYALAQAKDGTIYAGTGPEGVILQLKDDKVTKIPKPDDPTNISPLPIDNDGALLIGTGGETGKTLNPTNPADKNAKPKELFTADGVQYIWCLR